MPKNRKSRKGGWGFFDNKNKTCENNKNDWRKTWKNYKVNNENPHALYDSSFLYPGSFNLRGAVPVKGQLLDESGKPRVCPESVAKTCEENKQDWKSYWSSNPEYSHYIPHMFYPSDKNFKPIAYAIKPPDGKPCTDEDFKTYGNTPEYKEYINRPEHIKLQLSRLDDFKVEDRTSKPESEPGKYNLQSKKRITQDQALYLEEERITERKLKEKFNNLRKIQIIQSQLKNPINEKTRTKLLLACLFHLNQGNELIKIEKYYGINISKENPQLYIEELSKVCNSQKIKNALGDKFFFDMVDFMLSSRVNINIEKINLDRGNLKDNLKTIKAEWKKVGKENYYNQLNNYLFLPPDQPLVGNLTLEQIKYYVGPQEFVRLLLSFDSTHRFNKTQKNRSTTTNKTRKLSSLDEGDEEDEEPVEEPVEEPFEEPDSKLPEVASIIVSHNTRIQCLLDAIHQNDSKDKIRFMNCAILKLSVTPSSLHLSMVYQGNLSDSETKKINEERPYYVKDASRVPGHIVYPTFDTVDTNFIAFLKLPPIDKTYTFYIVRHGQGEHNDTSNIMANKFHVVPDTSITPNGITQATLAGKELYQYLTTNDQTVPTQFFVSDLIRTHETLFTLIDAMRESPESQPLITLTRKPIVLPCVHELPFKGVKGNCDANTSNKGLFSKLAAENYSKCKVNSDGTLDSNCNPRVDWNTLYLGFYGGKVRSQKDTITGTIEKKFYPLNISKCSYTSMIALAITYLTKPEFIEKHADKKIDNADKKIDNADIMTEMMDKSYEEQLKYSDENRPIAPSVFGGTRKRK